MTVRSSWLSRARHGVFAALTMIVGTGVLVGGAEVAARLVAYYVESVQQDARAQADTYAGAEWTAAYFKELRASSDADWAAYTYWRRRPFAGRFINIDGRGLRRTAQYSAPGARTRVFVLGGSTVWGTGARDDQTIPSRLGHGLAERSLPAEVINLGESGYVTGQDLATLLTHLKSGDIPGVAVFYGGINDVFSAFQSRDAGIPQNEEHRRIEFNAMQPSRPDKAFLVATSGLRFLAGVVGRRLMRSGSARGIADADADSLASAVAADYCANRRIVSALAREYGFKAVFVLQPVIFGKQHLTTYERGEADRMNYARSFFDRAYAGLDRPGDACGDVPLANLSHEFDTEQAPIYIDALHPGESGNARIAAAMLPAVVALWPEVRP